MFGCCCYCWLWLQTAVSFFGTATQKGIVSSFFFFLLLFFSCCCLPFLCFLLSPFAFFFFFFFFAFFFPSPPLFFFLVGEMCTIQLTRQKKEPKIQPAQQTSTPRINPTRKVHGLEATAASRLRHRRRGERPLWTGWFWGSHAKQHVLQKRSEPLLSCLERNIRTLFVFCVCVFL